MAGTPVPHANSDHVPCRERVVYDSRWQETVKAERGAVLPETREGQRLPTEAEAYRAHRELCGWSTPLGFPSHPRYRVTLKHLAVWLEHGFAGFRGDSQLMRECGDLADDELAVLIWDVECLAARIGRDLPALAGMSDDQRAAYRIRMLRYFRDGRTTDDGWGLPAPDPEDESPAAAAPADPATLPHFLEHGTADDYRDWCLYLLREHCFTLKQIAALSVLDFELETGSLYLGGEWEPVGAGTAAAIEAYLDTRPGAGPGGKLDEREPLFTGRRGRLTVEGIRDGAERAGRKLRETQWKERPRGPA